jgi:hypothetical protein
MCVLQKDIPSLMLAIFSTKFNQESQFEAGACTIAAAIE